MEPAAPSLHSTGPYLSQNMQHGSQGSNVEVCRFLHVKEADSQSIANEMNGMCVTLEKNSVLACGCIAQTNVDVNGLGRMWVRLAFKIPSSIAACKISQS